MPTIADAVCLPDGATVVSSNTAAAGSVLGSAATLTLGSGGTFDLGPGGSRVGTLNANYGTVRTAGELAVASAFAWNGATLQGGGTLVLEEDVPGTIDGGQLESFTIRNEGLLTHLNSNIWLSGAAEIDNRGTYRFQSGTYCWSCGVLYNSSGSPRFVNRGTVEKIADGATPRIDVGIDNRGSVEVEGGQLLVTRGSGASAVGGGSWSGSGAGRVVFSAGTFDLGTGAAAAGFIDINDGVAVSAAGWSAAPAELKVRGTLSLRDGSTGRFGTLRAEAGTVQAAGQVAIATSLSWGGTMFQGGGTLLVEEDASGTIDGGQLDGFTLLNEGELAHPNANLYLNNAAEIDNRGTYRFTASGSCSACGVYSNGSGSPRIVNRGTVVKSGAGEAQKVGVGFDNRGSVSVAQGLLLFDAGSGPGAVGGGTWASTGAGRLEFTSGTYDLGVDATVGGSLLVNSNATVAVSGWDADAADVRVRGTVSLRDAATSTFGTLRAETGTVNGSGRVEVEDALLWDGTVFAGSGTLHAPDGTPTTLSNGRLSGFSFENDGSVTQTGTLWMDGDGTVDNRSTWTMTPPPNCWWCGIDYNSSGSPRFVNHGTLRKDQTTGTVQIRVPVENVSTVDVRTGTLQFERGTTTHPSTGTWQAEAGALVHFRAGDYALANDSELSGAVRFEAPVRLGAIDAREASVTVNTTTVQLPGEPSRFGELLADGATIRGGRLELDDHLRWNGGVLDDTVIVAKAGSTSDLRGGEMEGGATYVNHGDAVQDSGMIWGREEAVIDNTGTYTLNSEPRYGQAAIENNSDTTSVFRNSGTLQKLTGSGDSIIQWAVDLSGTVIQGSPGRLRLLGPVIMSGPAREEFYGPGNDAEPNQQRACSGKPVDCASGNQFEVQTDLAVGGRGLGLAFTRTYNSQQAATSTAPGPLGHGWNSSYSERVDVDETRRRVTVTQADGSIVPFLVQDNGDLHAPPRVHATLVHNTDGTYTYTLPSRETMTFSASGRLEAKADGNGNATVLTYSGDHVIKVTDPAGRDLTFTYDGDRIASVTDPSGLTVEYGYDGGELASVTYEDDDDPTWGFDYDGSHQLTSMTDARGNTTTTAYDAQHRATSQTDALNRTRTWEYLADGTKLTEPNGSTTRMWFDQGQPTKIVRAQGTDAETTTELDYDDDQQLIASTDGNGHETTFGYDAHGNRARATDPTNRTFRWTYNARHEVLTAETPSGKVTTITRDTNGNPTEVSRPHGSGVQRVEMDYDTVGQLTTLTDPLGKETTYAYDAAGNQTSTTDATGKTTSATFDANSRVLSVTSPRGNEPGAPVGSYTTTFTRDKYGRVTKTKDPLGRETSTAYDANGNVTSSTDAAGREAVAVYDAENQLVEETLGGITKHTAYDAMGAMVAQTNGAGKTTSHVRDAAGRVVETVDPLSRHATQTYDDAGRVLTSTDALQRTTTFAYDDADRLTEVSSGTAATTATFEYDTDGRRASMVDRQGTSSYDYDDLGRLVQATTGESDEIGYTYDLADRRTALRYPNGQSVETAYDDAGRVTAIEDWLGNTTEFDYDADSNLTETSRPTSTPTSDEAEYDEAGQLTSLAFGNTAATAATLTYTYNQAGEQAGVTSAGLPGPGSASFAYDAAGRLTDAGPLDFAYDAADNPTTFGATGPLTYDDAGQLQTSTTSGTSTSYDFDAAGERVSASPAGGSATTYGYDAAGQLASVAKAGSPTVTYGYDGDGLRTDRTVGSTDTEFVWDKTGDLPLLLTENGTSYVYGPDGLPLQSIAADGTVRFFHHDRLGSTREVTDESGAVVAEQSYDAYGTITAKTGTARVPFGFAGEYWDEDASLVYLRARHYDPATGQFLTRDPLEGVSGQPYLYAGGDPVNQLDPHGLLSPNPLDWGVTKRASDVIAGYGDGATELISGAVSTATFGQVDLPTTYEIRDWWDEAGNDSIDFCSGLYAAGKIAGAAQAGYVTAGTWGVGREFTVGGVRAAPFGAKKGRWFSKLPHYHRGRYDPTGAPLHGQGMGRHRPWQRKSSDRRFRDRF